MLSDDTSFMNFQLCTTEQHCVEVWVTFWRWLTLIYATKLPPTRIFFFEILFLLCIQDIFKTCFTFFTVQCLPHVPLPSQHTVGIDVSCRSRLVGWCLDSVATLQPRAQFSVASPAGCVEELQTLYPSDTPNG